MMRRGYVICCTPRSGSNYFCELLGSTHVLGKPEDFFNGGGQRARGKADYPLDPEAQLRMVFDAGSTANGIYGLKMFCSRFDAIEKLDLFSRLPNLAFVALERHDLLGQAISDVIATQTQRFRSTVESHAQAHYDPAAIKETMIRIVSEQARWRLFFARNAIEPLWLYYEDLVKAPQEAVDRVARLLDIAGPTPIRQEALSLCIQRDASSEKWRAWYLSAEQNIAKLDRLPGAMERKLRQYVVHLKSKVWRR